MLNTENIYDVLVVGGEKIDQVRDRVPLPGRGQQTYDTRQSPLGVCDRWYIIIPPHIFKLREFAKTRFTNTGGVCGFGSVKKEDQLVSRRERPGAQGQRRFC